MLADHALHAYKLLLPAVKTSQPLSFYKLPFAKIDIYFLFMRIRSWKLTLNNTDYEMKTTVAVRLRQCRTLCSFSIRQWRWLYKSLVGLLRQWKLACRWQVGGKLRFFNGRKPETYRRVHYNFDIILFIYKYNERFCNIIYADNGMIETFCFRKTFLATKPWILIGNGFKTFPPDKALVEMPPASGLESV